MLVKLHKVVGGDEVGVDGLVVDDGAHHHVHVPDGVGQRDHAVRLEEEHAGEVHRPARLQLREPRLVPLNKQNTLLTVKTNESLECRVLYMSIIEEKVIISALRIFLFNTKSHTHSFKSLTLSFIFNVQ